MDKNKKTSMKTAITEKKEITHEIKSKKIETESNKQKKSKKIEIPSEEEEVESKNSSFADIELENENDEVDAELSETDNIDPDLKDNQNVETAKTKPKESYFSSLKFSELSLSKETLSALDDNNFITCTEIQEKTIPICLTGADIMGAAKTGSGKSLSFLIPAVELLAAAKFKQVNGTGVLILTPTRELALQLFNLAKDLLSYHKKTCALIMGGANRKMEAERF